MLDDLPSMNTNESFRLSMRTSCVVDGIKNSFRDKLNSTRRASGTVRASMHWKDVADSVNYESKIYASKAVRPTVSPSSLETKPIGSKKPSVRRVSKSSSLHQLARINNDSKTISSLSKLPSSQISKSPQTPPTLKLQKQCSPTFEAQNSKMKYQSVILSNPSLANSFTSYHPEGDQLSPSAMESWLVSIENDLQEVNRITKKTLHNSNTTLHKLSLDQSSSRDKDQHFTNLSSPISFGSECGRVRSTDTIRSHALLVSNTNLNSRNKILMQQISSETHSSPSHKVTPILLNQSLSKSNTNVSIMDHNHSSHIIPSVFSSLRCCSNGQKKEVKLSLQTETPHTKYFDSLTSEKHRDESVNTNQITKNANQYEQCIFAWEDEESENELETFYDEQIDFSPSKFIPSPRQVPLPPFESSPQCVTFLPTCQPPRRRARPISVGCPAPPPSSCNNSHVHDHARDMSSSFVNYDSMPKKSSLFIPGRVAKLSEFIIIPTSSSMNKFKGCANSVQNLDQNNGDLSEFKANFTKGNDSFSSPLMQFNKNSSKNQKLYSEQNNMDITSLKNIKTSSSYFQTPPDDNHTCLSPAVVRVNGAFSDSFSDCSLDQLPQKEANIELKHLQGYSQNLKTNSFSISLRRNKCSVPSPHTSDKEKNTFIRNENIDHYRSNSSSSVYSLKSCISDPPCEGSNSIKENKSEIEKHDKRKSRLLTSVSSSSSFQKIQNEKSPPSNRYIVKTGSFLINTQQSIYSSCHRPTPLSSNASTLCDNFTASSNYGEIENKKREYKDNKIQAINSYTITVQTAPSTPSSPSFAASERRIQKCRQRVDELSSLVFELKKLATDG